MKDLIKLANSRACYRVPILRTIKVQDGMATAHAIDYTLTCPTELADGLYDASLMKAGVYKFSSEHNPADFLPPIDKGKLLAGFKMSLQNLRWINKAAGKEEARYYLNGVFFASNGDIVATDGHRLHLLPKAWCGYKGDHGFLVPRQAIELMPKKGDVSILLHENASVICTPDLTLTAKLIDATYPDYQRVVPDIGKMEKTEFDAAEFYALNKSVALVDKKNRAIKINGDGLAVCWDQPAITAKTSTRFKFEIGFNAKYLAECELKGQAYYSAGMAPITILCDDGRKAVLMPIRG